MEPNSNNQTGERRKVGPIVATLVVVLILVIVGLYIFASKIGQSDTSDQTSLATGQNSTATSQTIAPVTNTADDPQSLQNDLNNSINGIDNQNI